MLYCSFLLAQHVSNADVTEQKLGYKWLRNLTEKRHTVLEDKFWCFRRYPLVLNWP